MKDLSIAFIGHYYEYSAYIACYRCTQRGPRVFILHLPVDNLDMACESMCAQQFDAVVVAPDSASHANTALLIEHALLRVR